VRKMVGIRTETLIRGLPFSGAGLVFMTPVAHDLGPG